MDWQVVKFLTSIQYRQSAKRISRKDKMEMILSAIGQKKNVEILYLKGQDEKSRRLVRPLTMGEMEFKGHPYMGMEAYCLTRGEKRTFNIDRILDISEPE